MKAKSLVSVFFENISILILIFILIIISLLVYQNHFAEVIENNHLNISIMQLLIIALIAIFATIAISKYVSSLLDDDLQKLKRSFIKASKDAKMIDTNDVKYTEFQDIAYSANDMLKQVAITNEYLQAIINAQKNIILVAHKCKLTLANRAFYELVNIKNLNEFYEKYDQISNIFKHSYAGYIVKDTPDKDWINEVLSHSDMRHKLIIDVNGHDYTYIVDVTNITIDHDDRAVIVLTDIHEIEDERKDLERKASTDALTKVANRLKFDTILEQQISIHKRYSYELSLIMFDIDYFKKFNDNYGHKVGDMILVEIANLISSNLRKSDTFARWGGEEFAIILPNSKLNVAIKIANKLRKKIENHTFENNLKITCSFGVAEYKDDFSTDDFLHEADKQLYISKERGRNRVSP
jgi:diguanylate cyclase (GGDEF)-like protein